MAGIVGRKWTRRTKQCCVCRVHFVPHPRVGERQRTCGRDECRREHQRRRSADWHAAHPGYDKAERLRARLRKETDIASGDDAGGLSGSGGTAPARQVDWAVAQAGGPSSVRSTSRSGARRRSASASSTCCATSRTSRPRRRRSRSRWRPHRRRWSGRPPKVKARPRTRASRRTRSRRRRTTPRSRSPGVERPAGYNSARDRHVIPKLGSARPGVMKQPPIPMTTLTHMEKCRCRRSCTRPGSPSSCCSR